jgi:saccharopine dehydrogenase (NADP+, L-glutamate forming)/spermidine synthase
MKTVLVLGAGLVTGPLVRYLLDTPDIQVTVASRTLAKAENLVADHPRGEARSLDVEDVQALREMIPHADLAISMLPYVYHVRVAELCVEFGVNMVTTSYVSAAMRALDGPAKAAGVTILNEIGVDPGIDHMSAMKVIHHVQKRGGQITSFRSWTGGLPAPEANTNPYGYKFSWSPRGVLLASRNAAQYLENSKVIQISGDDLFNHYWPVKIPGLDELEGYPNRDSLPYADLYGITSAHTVFRGTLRNPGWCATMKKFVDLGLLDLEENDWTGISFAQFIGRLIGHEANDIRAAVAKHLELPFDSFILDNMEWLGLFSSDPLPMAYGAPLDILTERMLEKMPYEEGERDMLVMQHEFVAEYTDHTQEITSTMIDFGIPNGDSSMSRTVGLPAAIASRLIVEGKITKPGVLVPMTPDVYEPVLEELDRLNIRLEEAVRTVPK